MRACGASHPPSASRGASRGTGVALLIAGALLAGCASQRLESPEPSTEIGGIQRLYRLHYQVPGERGDVRLILRRWGPEQFDLTLSDSLAGRLWTTAVRPSSSVLLDYRNHQYCRDVQELSLPEIGLLEVPLRTLPGVLAGEAPWPLPRGEPYPERLQGDAGRSLTLSWSGATLVRWSLWEGERPVLWWQRDARGGILSHVGGYQLRWRLRMEESLQGDARPVTVPAGFREVRCDE